jgi:hypothetical protein
MAFHIDSRIGTKTVSNYQVILTPQTWNNSHTWFQWRLECESIWWSALTCSDFNSAPSKIALREHVLQRTGRSVTRWARNLSRSRDANGFHWRMLAKDRWFTISFVVVVRNWHVYVSTTNNDLRGWLDKHRRGEPENWNGVILIFPGNAQMSQHLEDISQLMILIQGEFICHTLEILRQIRRQKSRTSWDTNNSNWMFKSFASTTCYVIAGSRECCQQEKQDKKWRVAVSGVTNNTCQILSGWDRRS